MGVDAVIARGLAKRPDERYPDCKAFVDDLRAALGVTDTQSRPRQAIARDRRVPIVVGLLVIVGLVGAVGFGLASGSGNKPSASPSSDVAVLSPSAAAAASPTEDVFPNEAEAAFLDALPPDLTVTCAARSTSGSGRAHPRPDSSVQCVPTIDSGANSVGRGDWRARRTQRVRLLSRGYASSQGDGLRHVASGLWSVGTRGFRSRLRRLLHGQRHR